MVLGAVGVVVDCSFIDGSSVLSLVIFGLGFCSIGFAHVVVGLYSETFDLISLLISSIDGFFLIGIIVSVSFFVSNIGLISTFGSDGMFAGMDSLTFGWGMTTGSVATIGSVGKFSVTVSVLFAVFGAVAGICFLALSLAA